MYDAVTAAAFGCVVLRLPKGPIVLISCMCTAGCIKVHPVWMLLLCLPLPLRWSILDS